MQTRNGNVKACLFVFLFICVRNKPLRMQIAKTEIYFQGPGPNGLIVAPEFDVKTKWMIYRTRSHWNSNRPTFYCRVDNNNPLSRTGFPSAHNLNAILGMEVLQLFMTRFLNWPRSV